MTNYNPIQLIKELDFSITRKSSRLSFGMNDYAEKLSVSASGQYIALSNDENIKLFNLNEPELSWQSGIATEQVTSVYPTDSGKYWISYSNNVRLINSTGNCERSFYITSHERLWGNDDWLLWHDEHKVNYADINHQIIHQAKHKSLILHVWKHGEYLRLLSVSKNKKYLYLHEWNPSEQSTRLKTKFRFKSKIGINGIALNYIFLRQTHAWKLQDGAVLIKVLPWAVTVSYEGKIILSDDHVAWHPVNLCSSVNKLPNQQLAQISASALEEGLKADYMGCFGSTPFLITTVQYDESVHFISTLWHKKVLKKNIDKISDQHLDDCLNDLDVASLVFSNCDSDIPISDNMIDAILKMLSDTDKPKKYETNLKRHRKLLVSLFESVLPNMLVKLVKEISSNQEEGLSDLYAMLLICSEHAFFASVCFAALNDSLITEKDREVLYEHIQYLEPVVSKKVHEIIPEHLLSTSPVFLNVLSKVSPETAIFLLDKAPKNLLDLDMLIILLEHFYSNEEVLKVIYQQFYKKVCKRSVLTDSDRIRLGYAMTKVTDAESEVRQSILLFMFEYDISTPSHVNEEFANTVHFIKRADVTDSELTEFMTVGVQDKARTMSRFFLNALELIKTQRLVTSFIYTMAQLNVANNREEFASLEVLENVPDTAKSDNYLLVETLWEYSEVIDEKQRWSYAVILLAAVDRCMGRPAIVAYSLGGSNTLMTAEAKLLVNSKDKKSNLIDELVAYIKSDFGISESLKGIARQLLLQD